MGSGLPALACAMLTAASASGMGVAWTGAFATSSKGVSSGAAWDADFVVVCADDNVGAGDEIEDGVECVGLTSDSAVSASMVSGYSSIFVILSSVVGGTT